MNYYKQGDAANADKIKAAFERNGIDTSANSNYGISNLFYYSYNGEVAVTQNRSIINIVKTHPDYKELELPVESKFKVGDWVVRKDGETFYGGNYAEQITLIDVDEKGKCIWLSSTSWVNDDVIRPWTIQDAKDGDVLYSLDSKQPFIYKVRPQFSQARGYCCINKFGDFAVWNTNKCIICTDKYIPATKEQRDLLFQKMKEAGYEWDADKKELLKIKHYAIANFRPFDKVLGRDYDEGVWICDLYSYYYKGDNKMGVDNAFVCVGDSHLQCIPYEGNEHLLGTTGMPSEEYINW